MVRGLQVSVTVEHHGKGAAGLMSTPVLIGGGVVLVLVLVLMSRQGAGGAGGVTVVPGAQPNPAIYQTQLAAYQTQVQAAAQERQDAMKGAMGLLDLRNTQDARMRQLDIQDKQVTGTLANDRADIDSRERVSLSDIAMRQRLGLRDIEMRQAVGMAEVAVAQSSVNNDFTLGKLRITSDAKLQNRAMDLSYSLGSQKLSNDLELGNRAADNDRYRAGTERQGTWFTGIADLLGPVGQFLKLFGL